MDKLAGHHRRFNTLVANTQPGPLVLQGDIYIRQSHRISTSHNADVVTIVAQSQQEPSTYTLQVVMLMEVTQKDKGSP